MVQDKLTRWLGIVWAQQEDALLNMSPGDWPGQGDPKDLFWVTVGANPAGEYPSEQIFGKVQNFIDASLLEEMQIVAQQLRMAHWEGDRGWGAAPLPFKAWVIG